MAAKRTTVATCRYVSKVLTFQNWLSWLMRLRSLLFRCLVQSMVLCTLATIQMGYRGQHPSMSVLTDLIAQSLTAVQQRRSNLSLAEFITEYEQPNMPVAHS